MGIHSIKLFISFDHFCSLDSGFSCYVGYILLHNKLAENLAS